VECSIIARQYTITAISCLMIVIVYSTRLNWCAVTWKVLKNVSVSLFKVSVSFRSQPSQSRYVPAERQESVLVERTFGTGRFWAES